MCVSLKVLSCASPFMGRKVSEGGWRKREEVDNKEASSSSSASSTCNAFRVPHVLAVSSHRPAQFPKGFIYTKIDSFYLDMFPLSMFVLVQKLVSCSSYSG